MAGVVRVGVVGTGIGAALVAALQRVPGAAVTIVCSAQRARADAVAARFAIPHATDDYRDVLAAGLDAVVIATPPALHAPMVLDAVAAGLHVFCEKPLAATVAEARAMRDAAHGAGVVHALGHQSRFAAPFARAGALLGKGYLGRLVTADCQLYLNPIDYLRAPVASDSKAGWYTDASQSGGLLAAAAGPHQVDLLRWYGGPIAAVAAQVAVSRPAVELADGTTRGGITAEDAFLVLARFASGALATMRGLPIAHHAFGMALDLHGTEGTLRASFEGLRGATVADRALADLPLPDAGSDRVALLTGFIEAIHDGDPARAAALPNFDDGVATQAVLEACAEAARTGTWITIDEE